MGDGAGREDMETGRPGQRPLKACLLPYPPARRLIYTGGEYCLWGVFGFCEKFGIQRKIYILFKLIE